MDPVRRRQTALRGLPPRAARDEGGDRRGRATPAARTDPRRARAAARVPRDPDSLGGRARRRTRTRRVKDRWAPYGAAAGAIAVILYVVGSVVMGTPPDFDAPGAEVAAYLDEERTRIQVGSAIHAAWAPLFVWFLATVASLTRAGGRATQRAGAVAFGCGVTFLALFLADVAALAGGAPRPQNIAPGPR